MISWLKPYGQPDTPQPQEYMNNSSRGTVWTLYIANKSPVQPESGVAALQSGLLTQPDRFVVYAIIR